MKKCGQECEVYSRIVGYLRPVKNWNKGKQEEFKDRVMFNVSEVKECQTETEQVQADKVQEQDVEQETVLQTDKQEPVQETVQRDKTPAQDN